MSKMLSYRMLKYMVHIIVLQWVNCQPCDQILKIMLKLYVTNTECNKMGYNTVKDRTLNRK